MSERAYTRNAADPKQVKEAARRERDRHELFLQALTATLSHASGRLVCWELLARAGVYRSVYGADLAYQAGRQDFGHELMALYLEADEEAFELMSKEARARAKRDNRTTDAAATPSVEDAQGEHDGSDEHSGS